jgi:hypothetical protein
MILHCRECNKPQEIAMPGDVTPPLNFLCKDCSAGRSMTDGLTVADVKTTALASRVYREGRAENVVPSEPGESAIERWNRLNPIWRRVYRQLHRAGYRRPKRAKGHPPSEMIAQWYEQVARFDWRCADCHTELTRETVHCWRSDSGQSFRVEDCVPLCQRCVKRRAANIRWKNNRPHAEDNRTYINEGMSECTATPPY